MGSISTAKESNPEVLESYFKRYPDVLKETIFKQHLLSLGHWFSDALDYATRFEEIAFCFSDIEPRGTTPSLRESGPAPCAPRMAGHR